MSENELPDWVQKLDGRVMLAEGYAISPIDRGRLAVFYMPEGPSSLRAARQVGQIACTCIDGTLIEDSDGNFQSPECGVMIFESDGKFMAECIPGDSCNSCHGPSIFRSE